MSMTFLDGLPGLNHPSVDLSLRTCGGFAFIRTPCFIGRICLQSATLEWLLERSPIAWPTHETIHQSRWIRVQAVAGSNLWISTDDQVIVEISTGESGELAICARDARTGKQLWDQRVPIPDAADWAEKTPAWPGANTEDIWGFLANDPKRLIVCLFRESRRSGCSSPSAGIHVMDLPPYACQTDAIRFDPVTGKTVWSATFKDVPVGIIERSCFKGIWSNNTQLGVLDFDNGTNTVLHESENRFGWPVRDGPDIAVPWHSQKEVGVDWIDERGCRTRHGAWVQAHVNTTKLHLCKSGLALQANDQTLWWLGKESLPRWSVRAKPYIYRVHGFPDTNVFIGTDGNGGRLLALDADSGRETLNLKPVLGGVGSLAKVPGHAVLVASFMKSRSYSVLARLLVLRTNDRRYDTDYACGSLLDTWEHGAICLAGQRLAIVDIRSDSVA